MSKRSVSPHFLRKGEENLSVKRALYSTPVRRRLDMPRATAPKARKYDHSGFVARATHKRPNSCSVRVTRFTYPYPVFIPNDENLDSDNVFVTNSQVGYPYELEGTSSLRPDRKYRPLVAEQNQEWVSFTITPDDLLRNDTNNVYSVAKDYYWCRIGSVKYEIFPMEYPIMNDPVSTDGANWYMEKKLKKKAPRAILAAISSHSMHDKTPSEICKRANDAFELDNVEGKVAHTIGGPFLTYENTTGNPPEPEFSTTRCPIVFGGSPAFNYAIPLNNITGVGTGYTNAIINQNWCWYRYLKSAPAAQVRKLPLYPGESAVFEFPSPMYKAPAAVRDLYRNLDGTSIAQPGRQYEVDTHGQYWQRCFSDPTDVTGNSTNYLLAKNATEPLFLQVGSGYLDWRSFPAWYRVKVSFTIQFTGRVCPDSSYTTAAEAAADQNMRDDTAPDYGNTSEIGPT